MTRRRIESPDIRLVTIRAHKLAVLIERHQLRIQILSQPVLVMTLGARRDRHIRFQPSQRRSLCDVDMTRRALGDVLLSLATAFMHVLHRDPHAGLVSFVRSRELVTTVTILGDRLLRFPMTVETRCMVRGTRTERSVARRVTDSAVVITLHRRMREPAHRDHVLMLVMRKLDRELQL